MWYGQQLYIYITYSSVNVWCSYNFTTSVSIRLFPADGDDMLLWTLPTDIYIWFSVPKFNIDDSLLCPFLFTYLGNASWSRIGFLTDTETIEMAENTYDAWCKLLLTPDLLFLINLINKKNSRVPKPSLSDSRPSEARRT